MSGTGGDEMGGHRGNRPLPGGGDAGDAGGGGGGGTWPVARLGRIERLRVLAAGLPGAVVEERLLDAPFDEAWGFVADLEVSVPAFDPTVARLEVVHADGERMRAKVWANRLPVPLRLDIELRTGWGWMVSRPTLHVVGIAAEPAGDRTRYAHLEATAVAGPRPVRAALRPALVLARRALARHVPGDVDGIERELSRRRARRTDPGGPGPPEPGGRPSR